MARTPAPAPAAPAAPPAPSTRRRRPRPITGEMNFELRRLPKPLRLKQVSRDPAWDRFKTAMVVIGGILVFWMYGEKMFLWGRSGSSSAPAPQVIERVVEQPASVTAAPQPPADPTAGMSPVERARYEKWVLRR